MLLTSGDLASLANKKSTFQTIAAMEARRAVESAALMEGEEALLAKF